MLRTHLASHEDGRADSFRFPNGPQQWTGRPICRKAVVDVARAVFGGHPSQEALESILRAGTEWDRAWTGPSTAQPVAPRRRRAGRHAVSANPDGEAGPGTPPHRTGRNRADA